MVSSVWQDVGLFGGYTQNVIKAKKRPCNVIVIITMQGLLFCTFWMVKTMRKMP